MQFLKMFCLILMFVFSAQASEFLPVTKEHPFTGQTFEKIKMGKEYFGRSWRYRFKNRVITLYNVETKEERLPNAPNIQEDCHDHESRFASWSYTQAFSRSVDAGVDFDLLGFGVGLGGSLSRSFEFSFERWVMPTLGIKAIHFPYLRYKVFSGRSYIQTVNLTTGESYNSPLNRPKFHVDYIKPTIVVKRKVLSRCANMPQL